MFTINSNDKCSIDTFPLLWRWNQQSHALLSIEELSSIEPLTELKAKELQNLLVPLAEESNSKPIEKINSESLNVNEWLSNHLANDETVFLSWDESTAIRLPSQLFILRNDDFCYPSSDDIFIYPRSGKWLMQFHHFELYTWNLLT